MTPLRIYTDTSVIGGCFDEEFAEHSNRLMQQVRAGVLRILVSEAVIHEVAAGPLRVQRVLSDLPSDCVEQVIITGDVRRLARAYLEDGIIGPRWEDDAIHIAAATIARADAIVSWNFKHIVRLDKIKAYNQVNRRLGYPSLTIISPIEVQYASED